MKKLLLISGVFAVAALASQTAQAEVKIRAGAASSTYTLGGDYGPAKSSYSPKTLGLTFAADNGFYVDLAVSGGTGEHDGWANFGTPAETFKRSDLALIFGASNLNPDNGIASTYYVGLKTGKTTLGANKAVIISSWPYYAANPTEAWSEETFTSTGIVFGGGASFPIASGRAGSVGVNAGLGLMGATWKDNSTAGYNVKAKTAVGFSFGVNYTYPITSSFGVSVDYKGNAYSYTFGEDTSNPFKVNEKIGALGATVYAKF